MQDEIELLQLWQRGDHQAGRSLFARYFPLVRRFFVNKAGEGIEDLIQETFTRCLAERNAFAGRSSFRTFVLGVARFVLFEYYRLKSREQAIDFGSVSVRDLDPSLSQIAVAVEERARVLVALRQLPVDQQIALELRYWENLSTNEVAEATGVPVGTVKSRLHAGRKELQRLLGQERLAAHIKRGPITLDD